jgi:integrase
MELKTPTRRKSPDHSGTYYQEGKYFCWRVVTNGRTVTRKAKTPRELRDRVAQAQAELAASGWVVQRGTCQTVFQKVDQHLEVMVKGNRALTTYDSYRSLIDKHLKGTTLASTSIDKLNALGVQSWINGLREKGLGDRSVQYLGTILFLCLGRHHRELRHEIILPKAPEPKDVYLTEEEMQRFMAELFREENARPVYRDRYLIALILNTGLRVNEALAIHRESIDLEAGFVKIESNLYRKGGRTKNGQPLPPKVLFQAPKNNSSGEAPLTEAATAILAAQIAMIDAEREARPKLVEASKLAFPTGTGKPHCARNVLRTVSLVAERAKVEKNITTHTLRHTYLTHLAAVEENLFYVSKLARHKSIKTTERVYAHLLQDRMAAAANKFSVAMPNQSK